MQSYGAVFLWFCTWIRLASVVYSEGSISSPTKTIGTSEFSKQIQISKWAVVGFFAAWCHHCQQFKPEYEKAAETMRDSHPDVNFFIVDATSGADELMTKYKIRGYPTVLLFSGNDDPTGVVTYQGKRTSNALTSWVNENCKSPYIEFFSPEEMNRYFQNPENKTSLIGHSFIAYVTNGKTSKGRLITHLAKEIQNRQIEETYPGNKWSFYIVSNTKPADIRIEIKRLPQEKFRTQEDEYSITYRGQSTGRWYKQAIASAMNEIEKRTLLDHIPIEKLKQNIDHVFVILLPEDNADIPKLANNIFSVAQEYRSEDMTFCVADTDKQMDFILRQGPTPHHAGVLVNQNEKSDADIHPRLTKYYSQFQLGEASLRTFIQQYLEKKIIPYLKTEERIKPDGNLVHLVSSEYVAVVNNPHKAVAVLQYTSWCAVCKEFKPAWKDLADRIATNPKLKNRVVIADINIGNNDVPDGQPSSIPRIVGYPIGPNSLNRRMIHIGDRNWEDLTTFISDLLDERSIHEEL